MFWIAIAAFVALVYVFVLAMCKAAGEADEALGMKE